MADQPVDESHFPGLAEGSLLSLCCNRYGAKRERFAVYICRAQRVFVGVESSRCGKPGLSPMEVPKQDLRCRKVKPVGSRGKGRGGQPDTGFVFGGGTAGWTEGCTVAALVTEVTDVHDLPGLGEGKDSVGCYMHVSAGADGLLLGDLDLKTGNRLIGAIGAHGDTKGAELVTLEAAPGLRLSGLR